MTYTVLSETLNPNIPYHAIKVGNVSHMAGGEHKYHADKHERIQQTNTIISSLRPGLYGDDPLATKASSEGSF